MDRNVHAQVELITYDRPHRLGWSIRMPATSIIGTLEFSATTDGTHVDWTWDVTPHGALKLLIPLIARSGQRTEERVWTRLKAYREAPYGHGTLEVGPLRQSAHWHEGRPAKAAIDLDKHHWHPSPLVCQIVLLSTVDAAG